MIPLALIAEWLFFWMVVAIFVLVIGRGLFRALRGGESRRPPSPPAGAPPLSVRGSSSGWQGRGGVRRLGHGHRLPSRALSSWEDE